MVLACCLGRIVWEYRSDIWSQIHSSRWNAVCNYLTFGWVVWSGKCALDTLVFGNENTAECDVEHSVSSKMEKLHHHFLLFYFFENIFLVVVIALAPSRKVNID